MSIAVGNRLKYERISLGLSQVTLASRAELDRAFLSKIESGYANPSLLTLANICYALGITLAEFFSEIDISLRPDTDQPRRANVAKPKTTTPKSRLR